MFVLVEAQERLNGAPEYAQTLVNVQQITSIMLRSDKTDGAIAQVSTSGGGTLLVKIGEANADPEELQRALIRLTAGERVQV